jgi:hypothetical protein
MGVGLFYLAGLLHDPDHPYAVSEVQFHMWLTSMVYEVAWLCNGLVALSDNRFADNVQATLSASRVATLFCLITLYSLNTHWQRVDSSLLSGEYESLLGGSLEDGARYGITSSNTVNNTFGKKSDAQTTSWLDYVLGYKSLFPFLWQV